MGNSSSKPDNKEQSKLQTNKTSDKIITEDIINHNITIMVSDSNKREIILLENNNYDKNAKAPKRLTSYI